VTTATPTYTTAPWAATCKTLGTKASHFMLTVFFSDRTCNVNGF
jgi:hypothetical protein